MMSFRYFFPMILKNKEITLKDAFSEVGVRFGMACEGSSFDSSVQAPLIKTHCAVVVPEVSGKMVHTQPLKDIWDWNFLNSLVNAAKKNNIAVFLAKSTSASLSKKLL